MYSLSSRQLESLSSFPGTNVPDSRRPGTHTGTGTPHQHVPCRDSRCQTPIFPPQRHTGRGWTVSSVLRPATHCEGNYGNIRRLRYSTFPSHSASRGKEGGSGTPPLRTISSLCLPTIRAMFYLCLELSRAIVIR